MWKKGIFIVLAVAAIAATYFFTQRARLAREASQIVLDSAALAEVPEPTLLYGIEIDSLNFNEMSLG